MFVCNIVIVHANVTLVYLGGKWILDGFRIVQKHLSVSINMGTGTL